MKEKQYRDSVNRLENIMREISNTVNQVSRWRCPYKNAKDHCTAGFRCRNQGLKVEAVGLHACVGSDKLDYRSAWEV